METIKQKQKTILIHIWQLPFRIWQLDSKADVIILMFYVQNLSGEMHTAFKRQGIFHKCLKGYLVTTDHESNFTIPKRNSFNKNV